MEETKQERIMPLDRRPFTLTLGDVFKWGGLIIIGALSYAKTSGRVEANTEKIIEIEKRFEGIEQKLEALQNYKEANELWKARMDEKFNYLLKQ